MRHLTAKIMITLACAIILLHAIVPHHHHDCADVVGFVFETEINCHCSHQHHSHDCNHDCDDHHSDHPFDICHLADMLSHLVLNTKEDDNLIALVVKIEVHNLLLAVLSAMDAAIIASESGLPSLAIVDNPWSLPLPPLAGGLSLRAPPMCA
jgi:hypothetical protein